MSFFKSLFVGSKPKSTPVAEMSGIEYSIGDYLAYDMLTSNGVVSNNRLCITYSNPPPNEPWTQEKQTKFLLQFADQKFIFDGKVGCILITGFYVSRHLESSVFAVLFKETAKEYHEYVKSWGEAPISVGEIWLDCCNGKPCVKVTKTNASGIHGIWSNQHEKDRGKHNA